VRITSVTDALVSTRWSPWACFAAPSQSLGPNIRAWPTMVRALRCANILGASPSLLVSCVGIASFKVPAQLVPLCLVARLYVALAPGKPRMALCHLPVPPPALVWLPAPDWKRLTGNSQLVSVWTDRSVTSNRDKQCMVGASWCAENSMSTYARLTGMIPNNNLAEVAAAVMVLCSWQSTDLHVHTDSKFVLKLVNRGLLAMEQDGWPNLPVVGWATPTLPIVLYRHFLFLIHWHNSALTFSWVKGHSGDTMNKQVDALVKKGVELDTHTLDISSLWTPSGWVDTAPVLNHQSLSHLMYCVVQDTVPNPLQGRKFTDFCAEWTAWIAEHFHLELDILTHFHLLWTANVPTSLKELLWKTSSGSLPLGRRWYGMSDLGQVCHCGMEMSLPQVWAGCAAYDLTPLRNALLDHLLLLCPSNYRTLDFDEWPSPFWFLLIVLKPLEKRLTVSKPQAARESAIGNYLWYIWKQHMKEMVVSNFLFVPRGHMAQMALALGIG